MRYGIITIGLAALAGSTMGQVGPTLRYAEARVDSYWGCSRLQGNWCDFLDGLPAITGASRAAVDKHAVSYGVTLQECLTSPVDPALDTATLATDEYNNVFWGYFDNGVPVYHAPNVRWLGCQNEVFPCNTAGGHHPLQASAAVSAFSDSIWSGGSCPSYEGGGAVSLSASGHSMFSAHEADNNCGYGRADIVSKACLDSTIITWTVKDNVTSPVPLVIAGFLQLDAVFDAGLDTIAASGCILTNPEGVSRRARAAFVMIVKSPHGHQRKFEFVLEGRVSSHGVVNDVSWNVQFPQGLGSTVNGIWMYDVSTDAEVKFGPAKLVQGSGCQAPLSAETRISIAKPLDNSNYTSVPWSITMDPNGPISGEWRIELRASNAIGGVDFSGDPVEPRLACDANNPICPYGARVNNTGNGIVGYEDLRRLYLARIIVDPTTRQPSQSTYVPPNYYQCHYLREADIDGNGYVDQFDLEHWICSEMADFNGDGFLDAFDYDDFAAAFEIGSCEADANVDGFVDGFDYDDFVAVFEAGLCGSVAIGCASVNE